ncbi:MAG: DNA repair protein RecO [Clostridia bacterium]|nr:DNA repair protein RecO [Clostridia bacterium]
MREVQTSEADKLLTLLTPERGKVTVSGKGVVSLKSRHMTACQLFSYSEFILKKTKKYFYISESETIECFFGIRYDIERLALATYICEVVDYLALEEVADDDLLRLTLNTLYALSEKKDIDLNLLKAAFEIRAAAVSGFTPDLNACGACGKEELRRGVFLDVMNGRVLCPECSKEFVSGLRETDEGVSPIYVKITPATLEAMRYAVYAPVRRFLSFSIPEEEISNFGAACEKYLLSHIEHNFKSLEYYRNLIRYGYTDE